MGKKKRANKGLEQQLQLSSIFEGLFDSQVISSVLKDSGGDYELALERLMTLRNSMIGNTCDISTMTTTDNKVEQIKCKFPSCDGDVISLMLAECDGDVDRVVEILSSNVSHVECQLPHPSQQITSAAQDGTDIDRVVVESVSSETNNFDHKRSEAVDTSYQFIKHILADFMPFEKIEKFLEERNCHENSSAVQLEKVVDDVLLFITENTTNDESFNSENGAGSDYDMFEKEIMLYETPEDQLKMTSPLLKNYENDMDYKEAKRLVRQFFSNKKELDGGYCVTDSVIEQALDLTKETVSFVTVYNPDVAIGWICEEINACQMLNFSQTKKSVISQKGNCTQSTPMTYARKVQTAPDVEREIAFTFGGDSEMVPDSNSQLYSTLPRNPTIAISDCNIDLRGQDPIPSNLSAADMSSFWRGIHQSNKTNMLKAYSNASSTRSRDSVTAAQIFKKNMLYASAESSKYALLTRNPNIQVENCNGFVKFTGFVKNTPRKSVSIDLHGLDVRSAVQFVKSLTESCYRSGEHITVSLIVGVGNHSFRNIPKLKPALMNFLKSNTTIKLIGCDEGVINFSLCK